MQSWYSNAARATARRSQYWSCVTRRRFTTSPCAFWVTPRTHATRRKTYFSRFSNIWIVSTPAIVFSVGFNEAINRRSRRQQPTELTGEEPDPVPGPEAVVAGEQTGKALEGALQRLVAEQREVVVLRHVAELSYEEMAEVLQVPEKTVKSRLHSARMRLRELLAAEHGLVGAP